MADIRGTNLADNLLGTPVADVLTGLGGNDTLQGKGGEDTLFGGAGQDLFRWYGNGESDTIDGGKGSDTVRVFGDNGDGDDFLTTLEDDGDITLRRTNLNAFALDIKDAEVLDVRGREGNDSFATEIGVDGPIQQIYRGGVGTDFIDLSSLDHGVSVDTDQQSAGFAGIPTQKGFVRDISTLDRPDGSDAEIGVPEIDIFDIEGIIGTRFGDRLFGGQENDTIYGGAGNDSIHPFAGVNFVDGGDGRDSLLLNALPVGVTTDLVSGSAGNNIIANFENVEGSNTGGDVILGDILDNRLDGNGGSDTIRGAAGDDTIIGGIEADLPPGTPSGNDVLFGDLGDDSIRGGEGTDLLFGGLGNDTLKGGIGDDTILGGVGIEDAGFDIARGGPGSDLFVVGDESDSFYTGNGSLSILDFELGRDLIQVPQDADINLQPVIGNAFIGQLASGVGDALASVNALDGVIGGVNIVDTSSGGGVGVLETGNNVLATIIADNGNGNEQLVQDLILGNLQGTDILVF